MTLGAPEWLHLLWGVGSVALLFAWSLRSRRRALERLGRLVPERVSAGATRVHRARMALMLAALSLVVLALAQPAGVPLAGDPPRGDRRDDPPRRQQLHEGRRRAARPHGARAARGA